jgi:hypothetical protein
MTTRTMAPIGSSWPAPTSRPSRTTIPPSPISRPTTRTGVSRSSSPASRAVRAATNGTLATSSPVSELDSEVSAHDSSSHGSVISSAVNSSSGFQCRSAGRSQPLAIVHGSSRAAPIPHRTTTTTTGDTSPTATLMSR